MKFLLSIALPLYLLDQATKWWITRHIEFQVEQWQIIPGFFHLCYWDNTGAAFGMFKDNNAAFIVLSILALGGLVYFFLRGAFRDRLSRWGVALLVAGIMGNVTDRLFHQHVVDFLLFYLHVPAANPWPAFNVADSCICVAAGLFILASFREARAPKPSQASKG
jgi:signal peptidase II